MPHNILQVMANPVLVAVTAVLNVTTPELSFVATKNGVIEGIHARTVGGREIHSYYGVPYGKADRFEVSPNTVFSCKFDFDYLFGRSIFF